MVTAFAILAIFLSRVLKWNCTHCNALKVFFLLIWWNPNHLFIKTASRPPILFEEDMLSAHTTVSLCWVTVPLSIASVFDEHCCTQTVPHCQQMHKVVFYSQLDLVWRITIAQCDQVWRTNSSVTKCGALFRSTIWPSSSHLHADLPQWPVDQCDTQNRPHTDDKWRDAHTHGIHPLEEHIDKHRRPQHVFDKCVWSIGCWAKKMYQLGQQEVNKKWSWTNETYLTVLGSVHVSQYAAL